METPTTPSSMEVDDDDDERAAFCSILNVVIDFNMEDATSMEPDEYQNGQGQQQVPVIRIFGPLLRKHSVNPPLQCKHMLIISSLLQFKVLIGIYFGSALLILLSLSALFKIPPIDF